MDLSTRLTLDLATTSEEITVRIADQRPGSLALFGELTDDQGRLSD